MRHSAQACIGLHCHMGDSPGCCRPPTEPEETRGKIKINLPPHNFVSLRSPLYCLHVFWKEAVIREVKHGCPPLRDLDELYPREAGLEEHRGTSHHELDHFQIVFLFQGFNEAF